MESVRQALGLPEPDVHWSREVREGHLSLFGQTDELHYFSGQEEPEESLPGFSSSGGLVVRTLPRHKAIERLNNAQPKKKTTIERANSNIAAV